MDIQKIFNANVYIDGTNNLVGRASEIVLPEISMATEEHKALGMIGTVVMPTGLEAMTSTIKWNGFYADALKLAGNPFAAHKLQVRASVEVYGAAGRVAEKPLVVTLVARFKKLPLGSLAPMASYESQHELTVTHLKVTLDREDLVEIDVMTNKWTVGGVDILAKYRAALGV